MIKADKSGTALRSLITNMIDPTKEMAKAMEKYGLSMTDANGKVKPLNEVMEMLRTKLGGLDEATKSSVVSTIAGKEAMSGVLAILNASSEDYDKLSNAIKNADGTSKDMAETMNNTAQGQITLLKSKLEGLGIQIGEKLLPHVNAFVDKLSDLIDWFGNLDEGTQQAIVKFGLLTFATGGVMKVVGGFTSSLGSLVSGLGKFIGKAGATATATSGIASASGVASGGVGMLAKGVGLATKLFTPWGLAIAGVSAGAVVLGKALSEDVVPKVDLFATHLEKAVDGSVVGVTQISEATKIAVGAYEEMDNEVTKKLLEFQYNNTVITEEIATDMKTRFNEMGKTITDELDKDYQNNLTIMQEFFKDTSTLTEQERVDMQKLLKEHMENQKKETEQGLARINEIYDIASKEKRKLTKEEELEIEGIRKNMEKTAVESLSETEKESAIILGRIKDQDGRITAEMASEHVKQLNIMRGKAVDEATVEYEERIRLAEAIRKEGGEKAEETANKIIEEAERQRKETIAKADDLRKQGIDKLKESYSGLGREVSETTGNILSWWDKLWQNKYKVDFDNMYEGATSKPYGKPFATGGYVTESAVSRVNELGVELVQSKDGMLRALQGQYAYLQKGDKVINHQDTKNLIARSISSELDRRMASNVKDGDVYVTVSPSINIEGNADEKAINELKRYFDNVSKNILKQVNRSLA